LTVTGLPPVSPERYVLGRFAAEEKAVLEECMPAAGEGIQVFLQQGIEVAMNQFNQKK
jgi:peptidyl-tRNA hydrolase